MITAEEQQQVSDAIREAESLTAGEIVVVVARQANAYRGVPLLWGLVAGLALPWPLILFTAFSTSRIFLMQLVVAAALGLLFSLPRLHLALVPRSVKRARAHEAAVREFMTHGLTRTRGRTGVLIYVAAAERYAEIIADIGVADRAGPQAWEAMVAALIDEIRAGRPGQGLVQAVHRAGALLAEHAPPAPADRDELPNRVILL